MFLRRHISFRTAGKNSGIEYWIPGRTRGSATSRSRRIACASDNRFLAFPKYMGQDEGLLNVFPRSERERFLGIHILDPCASEMISEAVIAFEFDGSAEDLARTVHAHPTLSETIKEAALGVERRQIHG